MRARRLRGTYYKDGITSVNIGAEITSVGSYTFNGYSALTDVSFAEGSVLETISTYAFANTGLTSINIPSSVTAIGDLAFYGCNALTTVDIPADGALTTIGMSAFNGCSGLTEITIPENVTNIGSYAFIYCNTMTDVYCYAKPDGLIWTSAGDSFIPEGTTRCHVPAEYYDTYVARFRQNINDMVNVTFVTDMVDMGIGEHLAGYSLSLDGDIGVNFYMELSDDVLEDPTAYMQFTTPDGHQDVPLDKENIAVIGSKTYYKFKCRIYADEMTSDITAQMFSGGQGGNTYTYTVQKYAQRLLDNSNLYDETTRAFAQATLDYGAAAQMFFGTNTGDLAAPDYMTRVASVDIEERTYTDNTPDDITYVGATLTIQSETTLSLYFDTDKELTFSAGDYKVERKIVKVDGVRCQVARIRGIRSEDLGNDIILTVCYDGGESCTVINSPMTYCYIGATDPESEENLPELCKALYNYWKAAVAYKAAHSSET